MAIKEVNKEIKKEAESKKEVLPEDIPNNVSETELREQLGGMTIQLMNFQKTEVKLRGIIKELREQLREQLKKG